MPVTIGRLGYSGELGYELIVPGEAAPALWRELAVDARECGFDAANSLRIESGYILFTNELAGPVNPFELGLERLVSFEGRTFIGGAALRPLRWREPARRLVGLDGFARRDASSSRRTPSRRGNQPGPIADLRRGARAWICAAIIVGVDGSERNIFWERVDDRSRPGYAKVRKIGDKVCDVGMSSPCRPA